MEFNQEKPIYLQIVDWMNDKILGGEWNSDERIPSVRDVAMVLQVNPNTAMRAFDHLQSEHVIYNKRGIGYFVEPDARTKILDSEKKRFLTEILPDIFTRMELLGISSEDLHEEYKNHKASKQ
ncbi:HTH-type transcriptional repressor YtrA [bioreactor metagenome]|uniref:HTH-type transcriptional repressor YtrA n=1 Tax=bioreactor metagenome TaxID=1076179 RepID=A0A645HIV0_9ZZZZ|nr:GntR family transcriptional regulator [Proteiniphilum sp.]MEA4919094.1 GntR family transcriptional regulator [Proteiniphilum sp.]